MERGIGDFGGWFKPLRPLIRGYEEIGSLTTTEHITVLYMLCSIQLRRLKIRYTQNSVWLTSPARLQLTKDR